MKKETLMTLLSYLTIYIVWGSTYFFIKMAVETIPPFYVVGLRWLFGGAILLGYRWLTGHLRQWPTRQEIIAALILGGLLLIGGNGLITVAEQKVDSYLVALILASTPMTIAVYDRLLLKKPIPWVKMAGVFIGVLGVAALLYNGESVQTSLHFEIILVLAGMALWGLGTSLGHTLKTNPDSFVSSGIQMLLVGLVSMAWAYWETPNPNLSGISAASWFGLAYLAVFGSVAFCAYNYLLMHEPAIRISSYAFVNPMIAVLLGLFVGSEQAVKYLWLGLPLILVGLVLMLYGEALLQLFKKNECGVSK